MSNRTCRETAALPQPRAEAPTSKTSRTTNYEISKTISKTINPVGSITKLSVSILIADKVIPAKDNQPGRTEPRSAEELKSLETMVSTALGLVPDRGDQINILSMPFTEQPAEALVAGDCAIHLALSISSRSQDRTDSHRRPASLLFPPPSDHQDNEGRSKTTQ